MIKTNNTKQESLAQLSGIKYQTMLSWISKDILPRADDAVKISQILNTTVEFLVTGTETSLAKEYGLYSDKYKKLHLLLDILLELNQEELDIVSVMIKSLAENKKYCKTGSKKRIRF